MSNALTVFKAELEKQKGKFDSVLPAHLTSQRLMQTAVGAIGANPYLIEKCSRQSLFKSIYTAAVFGLEIDGRQGAIVPFKGNAQFIPMVAGLITLAANAGYEIRSNVVRQNDMFEFTVEPPMLRHAKPGLGTKHGEDRGNDNPIIGAYAGANLTTDPPGSPFRVFEVMYMPDILAIRDQSAGFKSGRNSPWTTDFEAMCRKTPIRRLANRLPWQVQKAIELETRHEQGQATWAEKDDSGKINIEGDVIDGDVVEDAQEAPQQQEGALL